MSSWDSLDSKWLLCQPQDYSTLGANYDNLSYFNGLVPPMDGLVPSEDQDYPYRDGLTLRGVSPVVLSKSDPYSEPQLVVGRSGVEQLAAVWALTFLHTSK